MTHIMLDLETWGKIPGSDIRSIGAVVFDPVTGNIGDWKDGWPGAHSQFYIATDNPVGIWRNGDFEHGVVIGKERRKYLDLHRDPETVQWWSEQSAEAQAAFANPVDLWKALYEFRYWLWSISSPTERFENFKPSATVRIWANDPHFDVSILAAAYRAVGLPEPWHYRAPRSMKTITDVAGMTCDDFEQFNHGTAHNALDDAISQAKIVCEAYRRLGLQR